MAPGGTSGDGRWLIDLHWVRAHTVPMHLGLIDGTFVPHLISAEESPVPLPKIQMAPRLNLLKPSGHVMHRQFNIQQLYALPTLNLCVLYLSENKQRLVPLTT